MTEQPTNEDMIQRSFTVTVPVEQAFIIFTEELGTWWPQEYTWAGDVLERIGMETRKGGRCFEKGPYGFTCDWGRILVWEPPKRLVFTWQISPERVPEPNPDKASKVEVLFIEKGRNTQVEFMHRGFTRHGKNGSNYRLALDAPQGWPYILDRYVRKVSE